MTISQLHQLIIGLGQGLDFDARVEVGASESAWVDIVWFDKRLPVPVGPIGRMRREPILPVAGFEVELHTGLNAKHVKGSVSNLNVLGAPLGVIVIGNGNRDALGKQPAHLGKTPKELEAILRDRVERWVYEEAQPTVRIVVLMEDDVTRWAKRVESQLTNITAVPEAPTLTAEVSG